MNLVSGMTAARGVRRLASDQVPLGILTDLVNHSNKAANARRLTVGMLDFALRRTGRGNHAWLLVLNDGTRRVWKVSQGGRAKHGPTVVEVAYSSVAKWIT
jgi:hypothetical protein